MAGPKQRIAVLGGGVGALSAAFYLTEQPGAADTYDITVYQQGWRLGGKCASGHDMREGYGHRIYEHGLHIFGGFYYQAFDLLRRAYLAVDRPDGHPNQQVWDAFTPEDAVALVDRGKTPGADSIWYINFPPNDEVPGADLEGKSVSEMISELVAMLVNLQPGQVFGGVGNGKSAPKITGSPLTDALNLLRSALGAAEAVAKKVLSDIVLHQAIHLIELHAVSMRKEHASAEELRGIERFLLAAYLVQTIINGVIADKVIEKGYDSLDVYELSEWLYKNAVIVARKFPEWGPAEKRATELINWTPITSAYDYVFGYGDGGDENKRTFAAGTALRSFLLLVVGYKGHFFWKMKGAMGDVVIAPLYLALRKRGVKFKFFSRITSVNVHPTEDIVASIDYAEQVALVDPTQEYQPLIDVPLPGWPADMPLEGWPAQPLWNQLKNGKKLAAEGRNFEHDTNDDPGPGDIPRQLLFGTDFDRVILGISVGGLKQVCASFPARLPKSKWGPMFGALTLTRTCAMQLWFTRTIDDLGCKGPDRTLAGASQPYSAWSDMSHLLSRETWSGAQRPMGIAYFCGQLPGPENGRGADRKAWDKAITWLQTNTQMYWPRAVSATSPYVLDPQLLFDPEPEAGGDPLERQYIRANTMPSDLYVQSPKNSVYTRMDANQSGLSNLFLAGDWTLNGLNAGAAEAAAKSGARCAQAIAGTLKPMGT